MTFDLVWIHLPIGENRDTIGFGLLSYTSDDDTGSILGFVHNKKEKQTIIDFLWLHIVF